VATEAPAPDHAGRARHQLRTSILAGAVLLAVLTAVILAVVNTASLNQYGFLNFPLGFYFLAQGVLIFVVVVGFWFIRTQEHIDQTRSESKELE
jgi:putative solute:sodium symporter small subunit